jgi:hypothetical protein
MNEIRESTGNYEWCTREVTLLTEFVEQANAKLAKYETIHASYPLQVWKSEARNLFHAATDVATALKMSAQLVQVALKKIKSLELNLSDFSFWIKQLEEMVHKVDTCLAPGQKGPNKRALESVVDAESEEATTVNE